MSRLLDHPTSVGPRTTRTRRWEVYPTTRQRWGAFAVITLASAAVFYQSYVQGAVSPLIIADFGIPLRTFVLVSIVGNAVGAVSSWAAGLADRFGRVNIVLVGMLVASVVVGTILPATTSAPAYIAVYAVLSIVGGAVLVATSALMRDFSPQLGRATAMGLWALGPSLGNLLISEVTSRTLPDHPDWQFHLRVAGAVGVAALVVVAASLRDLSPALRNQVVVRVDDAAEVRAEGEASRGGLGAMWRPAIVVPALGISLFLMFYVTRVGFFVLYFVANFGYTPARANGLASWYWVANIVGFVVVGVLSDRAGVRKPFLLAGSLVSAAALAVFATRATTTDTSYNEFVVLLVLLAVAGATVSTTFLAAFTETVEAIDPAAVARGMAVYGAVLRAFVVVTLIGFMSVVTAAGVLVDQGARVSALSQRYAAQLKTLAVVDPAAMQAVRAAPEDRAAARPAVRQARAAGIADPRGAVAAAAAVPVADLQFLGEQGPRVQAAAKDGPEQWQRWWWICFVGQLLVVPLSWGLRGRWRRVPVRVGSVGTAPPRGDGEPAGEPASSGGPRA